MESSAAQDSVLVEEAKTEPDIDIPVLQESTREEPHSSDKSIIARDFAYAADNPLFWRLAEDVFLDEQYDEPESASQQDISLLHETSEGSGFKGAPPWLQSGGHDGLAEEDTATSTPDDELHGRAEALFDFMPEHENEFALQEGQIIYISSRHGLGWLVAVDIESGECGLVPEEYVRLLDEDDEGFFDDDYTDKVRGGESLPNNKPQEDADAWVDEPDTQMHDAPVTSGDPSTVTKQPQELTDEERQKIMDAAEREMALMEARMRDA